VTLRLLDTFSGIGGFSLAARWLGGYETVQFVERDPYCQRILRKHWPDVPIHDDICTFNPEPGSADVVCGGFPCQDVSIAGKQAGIKEGTRSGLFYELMRVVRLVGPRYIVLENVAAITSNGLDTVLGTLAEAGYDCEWACIPAADVGACHRRDRWWCVAYTKGGRRRAGAGQGTGQAGYERPGAGDGVAGSDAAHSQNMLSHGSPAGYGGESGRQTVPESRDGGGAEDVAHPHYQRQQERQLATIAAGPARTGWGDAPRRLNPNWRSYLSEPVLCRGDDGLSGRVDRLKALGNAVVPQVAMVPLARVLRLERLR
jgi:DNA (cytosine-5)-methyltransferase 1